MTSSTVVNLSELEGGKRIDAEYYLSEDLNLIHHVQNTNLDVAKLRSFVKDGYRVVYEHTNMISRDEMDNDDVFFLQASNVERGFPYIRAEEMGGVWHKDWENYPRGRVIKGELLIEVKGKAEKVAIVPEDFPTNTLISGSLYKLLVQDIEPEYILVYFLTKYGKAFRDRFKTNLEVSFVNKRDLYNIPIVILPSGERKKVKKLFRRAYESYKSSKQLYSEANDLLLEKIGLKDFQFKYKRCYTNNLADVFSSSRMDAEYFNPAYTEMLNSLKDGVELKPLSKVLIKFRKGTEVGSENYKESGKPFMRVSNLSKEGIKETGEDQEFISNELYTELKGRYEPQVGDFLLSKDATPGMAYVVKEPIEGILASGIIRVDIKEEDIHKEYLALCINSVIGQYQVKKEGGGSVITHWRPDQIKTIQVPFLPIDAQCEIESLIQKSHEERRKGKKLLEEAKNKIAKAIKENL